MQPSATVWCASFPSLELLARRGFPQARKHRDADQVLARKRGIVRAPGQRLAPGPLLLWIARLEVALVGDGNRVDVLERDRPPLPLIATELGGGSFAARDAHQLLGEVDSVVDAAVHPHAAERIVEV